MNTYIVDGNYFVTVVENGEKILLQKFNIWDNANKFIPYACDYAKEISKRDNSHTYVCYEKGDINSVVYISTVIKEYFKGEEMDCE